MQNKWVTYSLRRELSFKSLLHQHMSHSCLPAGPFHSRQRHMYRTDISPVFTAALFTQHSNHMPKLWGCKYILFICARSAKETQHFYKETRGGVMTEAAGLN